MMLWILIPAFNEEKPLSALIPKLNQELVNRGYEYKILVVNDGSTDNTSELLSSYKKSYPIIEVKHIFNRGLGETERDGFEYIAMRSSPEDYIVRVEGDNTHEPDYIFSLIEKLEEGYDVVNTSRFQKGGGQLGVSNYRSVISRSANIFMHMVFRVKGTKDYSCGYRAYRARVIQDALRFFGNDFIQLRGMGFTSTLEVFVKLNIMGCRFAEVPFILRYDQKQGKSKMISSITTLGYFTMAIMYHWPFGGWRTGYSRLGRLYNKNPDIAVKKYGIYNFDKIK